ncbi:MIF4G-domain-containing protein [Suillus brevipes Sb2]|nr:MIF4G-domain-containing protein [Suillus brevipes Sb2]
MATTVLPPQISSDGPSERRKRYLKIVFVKHLTAYNIFRSRSRSPGEPDGIPPATRRRSQSPSRVHIDLPRVSDVDPIRRAERERQLAANIAAMNLEKASNPKVQDGAQDEAERKAEFAKLIGSRSGGVYMPPARLRALQAAAANDKTSPEYQRLSWDALRKSLTGIVNRVNIANIKQIVPELFSENLIRGRGLFSRSIMKAQSSSLPFTPVFAAVVAVINTKLPQVGELVLTRLISQFRRSFKRNDKIVCHSTTTFIAHLVNQAVAHEIIALQILVLLLERPTDDSIEIAVGFMREVGAFLAENSPKANATVFERFRAVLNEGSISHRVQYMIEVLMQTRKDKYKDNPILPEGLDLVEEEEQITHQIQLEEELQIQEGLNVFKFDPNYLENEEKYKSIKAEILGEGSEDEESGSEESSSEDEDEVVADKEGIEDRTETNLVNLRRTIYLTIMNALNYEEAVHKLLKVQIKEGDEIELINMVIECCSQERSYSTFYGLVGERFSKLNRVWTDALEQAFVNYYTTIHRYETNRLRNISRFFGHMIATDAISWIVLECVKINEEDTTSSSRIFIKIMMQEMMESMGLKMLAERFKDEQVKHATKDMFPMDNPKNTRFSINYFTSIGLGVLTEEMREYLKVCQVYIYPRH